uniref:PGG domain-containing protein n=1 Tax=Oryza glumipatula TaxID=40148 RepID=A0A0D9YFF1_9ORYZ
MTENLLNWRNDLAGQADKDGRTPLHFAASLIFGLISSSPLVPVLQANPFQLSDIVLYACRNKSLAKVLNVQDKHGNTAIHVAVHHGLMYNFCCLLRNRKDNTIAFICSGLATINLMYSGVPMVNLPFRRRHFNISLLLVFSSVTSLGAAFALGMLLVLSPVAQLTAAAVCFMMMAASLYLFTEPLNGARVAAAVYFRMGNQALLLIARVLLGQTLLIFWPCVIIFGWAAISTKYGRK